MDSSSSTLVQLPLFPLNTVLFPGGWLPLQIFEVRYLDMVARCHRRGEPFGVVALSRGSEVRRPAPDRDGETAPGDAFFPVGTLARIEELRRPQPGLMIIRCLGTRRFRVQRSEQQRYGLWVGDVELLSEDTPVAVPPDLDQARVGLQDLARNIEHSICASGETGVDLPLHQPHRWDDCGWLANRWCEMLPLGPDAKQRLMALDSPLLRLELVVDLLGQMGLATPR